MPRIPDSDLQRLKQDISVQRLVEASGVELKRQGKDWAGCCPFHDDDTASLIVTPAKNLWHCFGCGAAGGPVDWVMRCKGVSFRHAVELLREDAALATAAPDAPVKAPVKASTVRVLAAPVALDADEHALMHQVVDYYHQSLKQSPEALGYLQSRGIGSAEAIEHFKLGYANRTLGLRLPQKNRLAGAELRQALQRLGIIRASGHEHFNGSLVVPILDANGQVADIYGRKLRDDLRAGTPKHLYLPAREGGRGVFNLAALQASPEIILCEAIIDALTFWCAGYRNVTTAYGIEGFTEELLQAFKTHGTRRVLIAYDRDEAGERGAAKAAQRLMGQGIECWRIQFPKGMDANEYALKVTPAHKSLGLLIRQALWLGQGAAPAKPEAITALAALAATPAPAATAAPAEPVEPAPQPLPGPAQQPEPEPLPEPLPASPMPETISGPRIDVIEPPALAGAGRDKSKGAGREIHLRFGQGDGTRAWRVRGLDKNLSPDALKVNVRLAVSAAATPATTAATTLAAACDGGAIHVDSLDLYHARQRGHYLAQAAAETGLDERTLKADLGRIIIELELLLDQAAKDAAEPEPAEPEMDEAAREQALEWLRGPGLCERILADFDACGVVGEATNKLVGYLAAVSRKLERPLAVLIQSSSAAGKSSLMDAILAFVPEHERVQYSAMTGQSLFYMGQTSLKHKILAIAEEEGAHRAAYALKLLQSEGELTIASTAADPHTGNLVTQQYRVEGPMSLFMTTTAIDIDEELMNRCLVLAVSEDREQTRAIHERQRLGRTLQGLHQRQQRQAIVQLHRNAQCLLRPLAVVNPWADQLTFLDDRTRTRRDHEKYLTLIDAIALLHQHQREIKSVCIEGREVAYVQATLADIELANRIAHQVLGTSLDELPPQTRRVLVDVQALVEARMRQEGVPRREVRFTRAQLRQATAGGDTQLKMHLSRLAELEYLLVHRAQRGQAFEYELLHDGASAQAGPYLSGLIDVRQLRGLAPKADEPSPASPAPLPSHPSPLASLEPSQPAAPLARQGYDGARSGQSRARSAPGRPAVGPWPGGGRLGESVAESAAKAHSACAASPAQGGGATAARAASATPLRHARQSYPQPYPQPGQTSPGQASLVAAVAVAAA